MSRFRPNPEDTISLFDEEFEVRAHPSGPGYAYAAEGRKATVYQVKRLSDGTSFALKVFKKRYQCADLINTADRLRPYQNLRGMHAAERRVVSADEPLVRGFSDLKYAMLMPWIDGKTWFDILGKASSGQVYLHWGAALNACCDFLGVMQGLEDAGLAHTDISSGNVMIDPASCQVQLLDLEDIYDSSFVHNSGGQGYNRGTEGYRHPVGDEGQHFVRPEGDRFASAILASEILILAEPSLAILAGEDGYFQGHRGSKMAQEKFQQAHSWLCKKTPRFADVLKEAWTSSNLLECPAIRELNGALQSSVNEHGPALGCFFMAASKASSSGGLVNHELTGDAKRHVEWEPFSTAKWTQSEAASPTVAKQPSSGPVPQSSQPTSNPVPPQSNADDGIVVACLVIGLICGTIGFAETEDILWLVVGFVGGLVTGLGVRGVRQMLA